MAATASYTENASSQNTMPSATPAETDTAWRGLARAQCDRAVPGRTGLIVGARHCNILAGIGVAGLQQTADRSMYVYVLSNVVRPWHGFRTRPRATLCEMALLFFASVLRTRKSLFTQLYCATATQTATMCHRIALPAQLVIRFEMKRCPVSSLTRLGSCPGGWHLGQGPPAGSQVPNRLLCWLS